MIKTIDDLIELETKLALGDVDASKELEAMAREEGFASYADWNADNTSKIAPSLEKIAEAIGKMGKIKMGKIKMDRQKSLLDDLVGQAIRPNWSIRPTLPMSGTGDGQAESNEKINGKPKEPDKDASRPEWYRYKYDCDLYYGVGEYMTFKKLAKKCVIGEQSFKNAYYKWLRANGLTPPSKKKR